jgi:hypothetical protein
MVKGLTILVSGHGRGIVVRRVHLRTTDTA